MAPELDRRPGTDGWMTYPAGSDLVWPSPASIAAAQLQAEETAQKTKAAKD